MIVKVLGVGCPKCKKLEQKVIDLRDKYNLNFELEKLTQIEDIMRFGVMMTPGLVINDEVKSSGKIPPDEELLTWLKGE